uniref:Uncharacterized protein n=1 Tax=Arundo donax TaxID=35708 RepID=A0A0A9BG57_ARUDO
MCSTFGPLMLSCERYIFLFFQLIHYSVPSGAFSRSCIILT